MFCLNANCHEVFSRKTAIEAVRKTPVLKSLLNKVSDLQAGEY